MQIEERLAVVETQVTAIREDVSEIREWVDELRQHHAATKPIEGALSRVFWIAVGVVVPLALTAVIAWARLALAP